MTAADLTPAEEQIILKHRKDEAKKAEKLALCHACIDVLKEWKDWSLAHQETLTYSTFVNAFLGGAEHPSGADSKNLYTGVKDMIEALDNLQG